MEAKVESMLFPEKSQWPIALWRASMLGKCMRLQLLEAYGRRLPIPPETQRMLALRSAAHELYQQGLVHTFGDVIVEKAYFDRELHVGGHADAVLHRLEPPVLIEIKTMNPFAFQNFVSGKYKPYWNRQIDFYARTVAATEGWEQMRVQVHLLNIGTGVIRIIDDPPREDYRPIAEALNIYRENDVLPPMDEDCGKCNLKSICTEPFSTVSEWIDAVGELTYAPTYPAKEDDGVEA